MKRAKITSTGVIQLISQHSAQNASLAEQWFERGIRLESSDVAASLKAYRKALRLDPEHARALVNLGALSFNVKDFNAAGRCFRKAIKLFPDYALAHFNLGAFYEELGDNAKASVQYQMALRIDPDYTSPHYNLACLLEEKGEYFQAIRHWKAYLKLDPSGQDGRAARIAYGRLIARVLIRS